MIRISATFTAEPIQPVLEFWARQLGERWPIQFAPYNQVLQTLLDPGGLFAQNREGANVILVRPADLAQFAGATEADEDRRLAEILATAAAQRFAVPTLVAICPPRQVRVAPQPHLLVVNTDLYPVAQWADEAADRLGRIAEACHRSDLTFGLEVEANLVGQTGELLAEIHRRVNHPALVLVFDAANLVVQGFSTAEVFAQWEAMKPGLGWVHIKDYRKVSSRARGRHVEEDTLANFVPADLGAGGHDKILADLRGMLPALSKRLERRGIPGVFLDLEPHVRGGGQFGGTSGPDGMGVALRSLCRVLDGAKVGYHLRDFEDLLAARGIA